MRSQLQKCVVLLFLLAPVMFCQNSPLPNGVHQHDGFFLRFATGFGYSQIKMTTDEALPSPFTGKDPLNYSGVSFANRIQVGGTISDNVILYGESGGVYMSSPSVEVFGESVDNVDDVMAYFGGFGPGITYYIMPENFYFSLSILLNLAIMDTKSESNKSNPGYGFNILAGKEWWVGAQWGLGIAIYGYYNSQGHMDFDELTMSAFSFGVVFSATHN